MTAFGAEVYAARMARAARAAEEAGLAGVLVTPGPDLTYLCGYVPMAVTERLTALVVSSGQEPALLVPALERPEAEHARTIARHGWKRQDIRYYLWAHSGNKWKDLYGNGRYGAVYNRNLPVWYKREPEARTPIVPGPDNIHLFVAGGEAGRFSAFIPGWGHMSSPVLRAGGSDGPAEAGPRCVDGTCYL